MSPIPQDTVVFGVCRESCMIDDESAGVRETDSAPRPDKSFHYYSPKKPFGSRRKAFLVVGAVSPNRWQGGGCIRRMLLGSATVAGRSVGTHGKGCSSAVLRPVERRCSWQNLQNHR